ncbi:MAG TPA: arginine deiminase family protein [Steroidobacteraceae bacterium]
MSIRFTRALVRKPGPTFAAGLTTAGEGAPDLAKALEQHERYCEALGRCGVAVTTAATDDRYPDGTFVEDTAVISGRMAVVTWPGAPTRQGEIGSIEAALARYSDLELHRITAPGTVDGGDICQAGTHFFIGESKRTNAEGARQLAAILARNGYTSSVIDIRDSGTLLHLKSGIAFLGDDRMLVVPEVPAGAELARYELLQVPAGEEYAANCIRVNDHVLVAAGYPRLAAMLDGLGLPLISLDTSEYRKMDGGLSCLSLRF